GLVETAQQAIAERLTDSCGRVGQQQLGQLVALKARKRAEVPLLPTGRLPETAAQRFRHQLRDRSQSVGRRTEARGRGNRQLGEVGKTPVAPHIAGETPSAV